MNIYEIDSALEALIDPETGELLDEDSYFSLKMERDKKAENTILMYKNTLAEYKAVKAEAEALTKRSRSLERNLDRLKKWIDYVLGGEKFKTGRCSASFRQSESVEIEDETALVQWAQETGNDDCLTYKPPVISKAAVKEKLRSGINIPGAQIIKKRNVVIK